MKKLWVLLLSLLAATSYGVVHDEITVRICLEYFAVAHPPLFPTTSPTLLALCWGVAATAGIGLALGAVLAVVSQSGAPPPWPIPRLARAILLLLAIMAASALGAGALGYELAVAGLVSLPRALGAIIPIHQHDRFMAVWFAHGASYLTGLAGGSFLCLRVWWARGRPRVISVFPQTRADWIRALLLTATTALALWFRFARH